MRYGIIIIVLSLSIGLTGGTPSRAGGLQEKIDQVKHTLEQVRRDIEKTRKQLDQSRKQYGTALQNIEDLDRRLHRKRGEIEANERGIKHYELKISRRKTMLVTRVRRLYMEGRTSWFRPLLSADSYVQFQHRVKYLSALNTWEARELEQHRRDMEHLEQQRRRLTETLRATEDDMSRAKVDLASLAERTRLYEESLSASNRKEALYKQYLQQQGRVPDADSTTRASGTFHKGALLWPVDGEPVSAFGRQKHPAFDTYVDKKGIEIETKKGESIRAVSGGKVVYAGWLKGYGFVVILDHGRNYLTFYAHASSLEVEEGQKVAKGAVLGKTGASGLTDRVILYFELREGIKPLNPLGWFARR